MGLDRRTRQLLQGAAGGVALIAAAGLGVIVTNLAQIELLGRLVADLSASGGDALRLLGVLAVVVLTRTVLAAGGRLAEHRAAGAARRGVLAAVVDHLELTGPSQVTSEHRRDLVALATDGADALDGYVATYLPRLLIGVASPVLVLGYLAWHDPVSAAVLVVLVPALPALIAVVNRRFTAVSSRYLATSTRLAAGYLEALQGLTTLTLLGAAGRFGERLAARAEQLRAETMRLLAVNQLALLVVDLLFSLGTVVVASLLAVTRLASGAIDPVTAVVLVLASTELTRPLQLLGSYFFAGGLGRAAVADLDRVLDAPADPRPAGPDPAARTRPRAARYRPPSLVLDRVALRYPDGTPALREVTLSVPAGRTLAIVGPSGSGKTTLLHLLCGFLAPTRGHILLDGVDLADLDPAQRRRRVCLAPQDPMLFHGTIEDNLRRARPHATAEELARAVATAHLDRVLSELPHGYATPIGDRGQRLSGGQAQRLALARVLLSDAPLVLFDEPTAQLDAEAEAAVTDGLRALARDRTVVVVAHRLSTLQHADEVAVIVDGRVVETGSPDRLAVSAGPYARLAAGQVPA